MGIFNKKDKAAEPSEVMKEFSKLFSEIELESESHIVSTDPINELSFYFAEKHKLYSLMRLAVKDKSIDTYLLDKYISINKLNIERNAILVEAGMSNSSFIHTKVVGVTFNNDDGTSRQDIIAMLGENEELKLEPYKYEGEPAIGVYETRRHMQVGNLKKELAKTLYSTLTNNLIQFTLVREITGGENEMLGCNILIVYKE